MKDTIDKTEDSVTVKGSKGSKGKITKKKKAPVVTEEPTTEAVMVDKSDYLTPKQIVAALDKYIVGQDAAKKSVAIALRNRWRRRRSPEDIRDDILPNNIIMIGQTGVGKTEIARRLADLVGAPFVKVEASKFTEVGYVGRDVESMIRDLVDLAISKIKKEQGESVQAKAEENATERLLDLLLPTKRKENPRSGIGFPAALAEFMPGTAHTDIVVTDEGLEKAPKPTAEEEKSEDTSHEKTREKMRVMLEKGKLDHRTVEINVPQNTHSVVEIFTPQGMEELGANFQEMFAGMAPKKTKNRKTTVSEARKILIAEEVSRLVNMDDVVAEALTRAQESGIVFLDEIDKIAGKENKTGPDVSREGVQRDILPIVEGCTVSTKYGMIKTDHILFIAAGAFHMTNPSDLIPELQGRFPIRVELDSLTAEDFERILTEPKNALVKQYQALMGAEGVKLSFTDDAISKMAEIAEQVNTEAENIGARRLHTIMSALLEDLMFETPGGKKSFTVNEKLVTKTLKDLLEDEDLSRYML